MLLRKLLGAFMIATASIDAGAQVGGPMETSPYSDYRGISTSVAAKPTSSSAGARVVSLSVGSLTVIWPDDFKDQRIIIKIADTLEGLSKTRAGLEVSGTPPLLKMDGLKPGGRYYFDVLTLSGQPISSGISGLVLDRPLPTAQVNTEGNDSTPPTSVMPPARAGLIGNNMADFVAAPPQP